MQLFWNKGDRHDHTYIINRADVIHQIKNVLRMNVGDIFWAHDSEFGNRYKCKIEKMDKTSVTSAILSSTPSSQTSLVSVAIAMLNKSEKIEYACQKLTELGVQTIYLFEAERSIINPHKIKKERIEKIITEAKEQSFSPIDTQLEIVSFEYLISSVPSLVVFHFSDTPYLPNIKEPITGVIGPEGGWTEKEILSFTKGGSRICRLGNNILRAETAAIAFASLTLLTL